MFATQMFDARRTFADGQGTAVIGAQNSARAMELSGLGYNVVKKEIMTVDGIEIPDKYAVIRDDNNVALGVVGRQYEIVQNADAFSFTDDLIGEGVTYETAGYFGKGERVWMLARLPEDYDFMGDKVTPYVVFTNTHDGTGSVRVCMTPIRVICSNTLNMAIKTATRVWSAVHKRGIAARIDEARETLGMARNYMTALNAEMEALAKVKLSPITLEKIVLPNLIKIDEDKMTARQIETRMEQRAELRYRYLNAPDLSEMPKSGYRFINAVADYVDHTEPGRETKNWKAKRFENQIVGNDLLDEARKILLSVA